MVAVAQTRDGENFLSFGEPREIETRVDGSAIDQNGTCAAVAFFAAALDVGIAEVAQRGQQCCVWIQRDVMRATVDE